MHWFGLCLLCLLTLALYFKPSTAPVVTRNRDHFHGLNLKSIDFETANDTNEADVYSDLKYLKANTTAGYIGYVSTQEITPFETSQASIASQADAIETPKKKGSISGADGHLSKRTTAPIVANHDPCATKVNNISCTNGTISSPSITKAFDMFNQMLGVVSLVELLMLSLLVFISRCDTLVALLTCNRKALCKPNLDPISHHGGHGSAGGLLQKTHQILGQIASSQVEEQPAMGAKESASNAPSGTTQQPVNSQTGNESKQAECRNESPLSGAIEKDASTAEESLEKGHNLQKSDRSEVDNSSSSSPSSSPAPRPITSMRASLDTGHGHVSGQQKLCLVPRPIAIEAF